MSRYFTRLATGVLTASALTTAAIAQDATQEQADSTQIITNSSQITLDSAEADALSEACTFYANIQHMTDAEHFDGPTMTPHEDMAYAALQSMLATIYNDNFYDQTTRSYNDSVITFNDADRTDIDTLTLGNTILDIDAPASGTIHSYDEQCQYMANAAVNINREMGSDIFALYESAVNGALHESRDPHTSYLPPADSQATQTRTSGQFGGLGVEVSKGPEGLLVNTPIEGTPAEEAGIVAGDIIISANGQPLQSMSLDDAVDLIRGPVGSDLTVTIKRGNEAPFDLTLTRGIVRITAAEVEALETDPNILHIDIETFSRQTVRNIIDGLNDELETARNNNTQIDSIILDFRNNPGGLLQQAELLSDIFVNAVDPQNPERLVAVGSSSQDNIVEEDTFVGTQPALENINITVLVNRGSASASEIVSAVLQDAGYEVIGNRSFGKGSVQTMLRVTRSGQAPSWLTGSPYARLKVTTDAFFPGRSGLSNQGSGVIPDIDVQYNDIRDELNREGTREEDLPNALHIPGQNRINQVPEYICSLNTEFSGALDDQEIATVPDQFEVTMSIRNEQTDEFERQQFFDADLMCASLRLQGIDSNQYVTISSNRLTPAP